jgi:hypothetical protein
MRRCQEKCKCNSLFPIRKFRIHHVCFTSSRTVFIKKKKSTPWFTDSLSLTHVTLSHSRLGQARILVDVIERLRQFPFQIPFSFLPLVLCLDSQYTYLYAAEVVSLRQRRNGSREWSELITAWWCKQSFIVLSTEQRLTKGKDML